MQRSLLRRSALHACWRPGRKHACCALATRSEQLSQPNPPHRSLEKWLVDQGGAVCGVELCTGPMPGSRALTATQDHAPGALLVSVPRHAQLCYSNETHPGLLRLFERIPVGSDTGSGAWQFKQALTLLAHQARGAASPLHPHIQALPGAAPGVAVPRVGMLLPLDLVEKELQYAPLIQDIMNHKFWWERFMVDELAPAAAAPDSPFLGMEVTKEAFGAAVAVAISRCFALRKTQTHSMPPLIDMADHALVSNAEVRGEEDGTVRMYAAAHIRAGDPITLTYGPHSNAELLLSYGFVLSDIPHTAFRWACDVDVLAEVIEAMCGPGWVSTPLPAWKRRLLDGLGVPASPGTVQLDVGGSPLVPGQLLGAVRVLVAQDDADVALEAAGAAALVDWSQPVARQHEVAVMRALVAVLTVLYQSFPTTIQQDKRILLELVKQADMPNSHDVELMVRFRLSVKQRLEAALQAVLKRSKELQALVDAL